MKQLDLGPTSRALAENIQARRESLSLSYTALSAVLEENQCRIPPLGLRRIEALARRVDADELVALAFALQTSPSELLSSLHAKSATGVPSDKFVWAEVSAWLEGRIHTLSEAPLIYYWEQVEINLLDQISTAQTRVSELDEGARNGAFTKWDWEGRIVTLKERLAYAEDRLIHWRSIAGRHQ